MSVSGTIKISLFSFMRWFEHKLDQKHSPSIQTLKTLFLTFCNLVKQLIATYLEIKTQMEKQDSEFRELSETVIDTSIQILLSMTENIPICYDLSFCQNFAHDFESKLTLLCSYYHSLSHIQQDSKTNIRRQKQKIVDGINMLYLVTGDIKQQTKQVGYLLKMISDYKKIFNKKLNSIAQKLEDIETDLTIEYKSKYEQIPKQQKNRLIKLIYKNVDSQQKDQNLLKFVQEYIDLIYSTCEYQIQLQNILQEPIRICNQLKNKKKILNHMMQQSNWNSISRQLNLLLKNNFITKEIKKIKIEQFISFLKVISYKKDQFIESSFDFQRMENKIKELLQIIVENLKEIDKVDRSQIIEFIHHQKYQLSNQQVKKIIQVINQSQNYMYKFYKVNEEIKSLDRFVQTIVAKQFKTKVKLLWD